MINDGDKESGIQAGKAVADDDQESEGKMNIIKEYELAKEIKWGYWRSRPERKTDVCVLYAPDR